MLNSKTKERELAYLVTIDDITPIEGADRVELAHIGGWTIMVKKGQFNKGGIAIYFEIDSKAPETEPFAFLADKHYKIKTQKYFKGTVISQGLLMHPEDFGWTYEYDRVYINKEIHYVDNDSRFLTKILNVTYADEEDNKRKANSDDKYKKMAQRRPDIFKKSWARWFMKRTWGRKVMFFLFGKKRDKKTAWPTWVVKTDEERVQNMPYILKDKSEWIATEKLDGTSTTFTMKRKGRKFDFFVCSRNVVFDKPDKQCYYETNVYTEMAEKYKIEKFLKTYLLANPQLEWVTLQGETYGVSIQKRDYSLKTHDFAGFNFIDSANGRYGSVEARNIAASANIPWVPIVDEQFILPDTVEELLDIATDASKIDGGMREGLVFRSKDGSKSFKAVSNQFLLKYHQ